MLASTLLAQLHPMWMWGVVVAVGFVAWLTARRMLTSLERLNAAAAALAAGDLSQRIEGSEDSGEVGTLSKNIQALADTLRATVIDLREAVALIEREAGGIGQGSAQQAASIAEQSVTLAETNTVAQAIASKAHTVCDHAEAVASSAQRSEELATGGQKVTEDARSGLEQLRAQVLAIAHATEGLSSHADRIGEIIEAVKDLAEQSNMLALNASIEAAKAGESGKGFAVVAGEMRALAEASRAAALQVEAILREVQKGARLTAQVTDEGSAKAWVALELAEGAGDAIAGLAVASREASQAAREIADGSRRQTSDVEQIGQALRELAVTLADAAEGARTVEKGAEGLVGLSRRLAGVVARFHV